MKWAYWILIFSVPYLAGCTQQNAALSAVESRLKLLEDERAVLYALYTYAHGLDYDLEAEWQDIWTEDAILYWPQETLVGREAIMQAFRRHPHAPEIYWKHFLVEPRIHLDGDQATSESYLTRLVNSPNGPVVASFGRYRDVFVREADGKWRIKEHRTERESCVPDPKVCPPLLDSGTH